VTMHDMAHVMPMCCGGRTQHALKPVVSRTCHRFASRPRTALRCQIAAALALDSIQSESVTAAVRSHATSNEENACLTLCAAKILKS
jgi:glycine/serine hydroxymethyltransferase